MTSEMVFLFFFTVNTPVKNAQECLSPYTVQDYLLAVEVYESLLDQLPGLRSQILSVMGRLHLTLGDLPSAQSLFSLAATSPGSSGEEDLEEGEEKEKERIVRAHINQ